MKIYIAIIFVIVSFSMVSKAQHISTKDGFISISLGAAIPTGDFGDDDNANVDAGFAQGGAAVNLINFGYLFSKNIGITAMLSGAAFPMDDASLGNNPLWSYGTFLVGPLFTIRNNERPTEFDFRFMFGSMNAQLDLDDGSNPFEGDGGAVAIGAGMRYNLSDLIGISGNLDIISGTAEFDVFGTKTEQTLSSANVTVGIVFRLK